MTSPKDYLLHENTARFLAQRLTDQVPGLDHVILQLRGEERPEDIATALAGRAAQAVHEWLRSESANAER